MSDYADAVVKLPFTLGAGAAQGDVVKTMVPNAGALSPSDYANGRTFQQYISLPNNTLGYDQFRLGGSSHYHRPRGSFKIEQIFTRLMVVKHRTVFQKGTVMKYMLNSL